MKKNIPIILAASAILFSVFVFKGNRELRSQIEALKEEQEKLVATINEVFGNAEEDYLDKGTLAPDFELLDTTNTALILSKNISEKQKVLVFSSSECPYCSEFYPKLDSFSRINPDIDVLVVQGESSAPQNKKFLDSTGYNFKMLVATDQVFRDYKITGTPTTVLLDRMHKIDTTFVASTVSELAQAIH